MKTNLYSFYLLLTIICQFWLPTSSSKADGLPDLGDSSVSSMSSQEEIKIGQEAYKAMLDSNEIIKDSEISTYINTIGQRIARNVEGNQKFTFFVVDDGSINAFAMPGGYIGVNRGLLLTTQSEGELASVLAHEIAHVTQHHMARMKANGKQSQLIMLGTLLATAIAASKGRGDIASGALQAGIGLSISKQLSYSRDFEREADRIGMQYLAKAGFDARNMPMFFSLMQNVNRFNDNNAYAFLFTHPVTSERISEGESRAANYPVIMRDNSVDYLLVREKLRVEKMLPHNAIQYYQNALSERRYLNEGAQYYGLARAQMLLRNWNASNHMLSKAKEKLKNSPMLLLTGAQIAKQSGQFNLANQLYNAALKIYPTNKSLIYGKLNLLIEKGDRKLGLNETKKYLQIFSDDYYLYQIQAQFYGEKDALHYHAALGNALYFSKEYAKAMEQYQLASSANGDDFYLRSSIDARLAQLKQIIKNNNSEKNNN